ncbi:heavy metal-associated isoprenylated plant protein 1-like isoform X2 [Eutrema salsugineum]|uniref:heavy metal-associated isoprenylated plant protein 1-like isoform X2 n=1 Tax=Eutrema salsugineum TaxID=72664 RepID=UPI000CED00CC|nr:heavy metal-associated isoprenylated plant protein 1-like isoform X2 [Eutrema salsugineum]
MAAATTQGTGDIEDMQRRLIQKKMETEMVHDYEQGHAEKKKGQDTSPVIYVTVVLSVDLHCDGCIARIVTLARRLEGYRAIAEEEHEED